METGTRNRQTPRETLPPSAGISDLRSRGIPAVPANSRRNCSPARSLAPNPRLQRIPAEIVHPVSVHTTASTPASSRHLRRTCRTTGPRDRKAPIGRDNGHRAENVPLRGERGRAGPGSWRRRPARLRRRATRPPPGTLQDLPACACDTTSRRCVNVPNRVCSAPGYWMLVFSRGEWEGSRTPTEGLRRCTLVLLDWEQLQCCYTQRAQIGQMHD